ncbi:hypothetical protein AB0M43_15980 [Longispora sp. NPDC051575]|uniref:hypothetical protein n=1 Tax=Longispora sp. NPDC051575 TaxID=3154943 RepID=UPI003446AE1E
MTPDQLATALVATFDLDVGAGNGPGAGAHPGPADPLSPADFGGGAPGGLGELGRAVHAQWAAALAARAAEDTGQRARLAATAEGLRAATDRYSTTDTLDG